MSLWSSYGGIDVAVLVDKKYPGKKRMTLQEVREREMMKDAAMAKEKNDGMGCFFPIFS